MSTEQEREAFENENYADEFKSRNPKYQHWADPLYIRPAPSHAEQSAWFAGLEAGQQREQTNAALRPVNVWQQAVDDELVSAHLGIAGDVSIEEAKRVVHELICWNVDVSTDPHTNGGKSLQPDRKPLTDEQIESARSAAERSWARHMGSVRGQMVTPADDFQYHFARAIEQAHGIGEA